MKSASDQFGELTAENRFALLQRVVDETPPGSAGVLFLPWLGGSMAPTADDRVRGGFLNIGLATKRSELARAVLEAGGEQELGLSSAGDHLEAGRARRALERVEVDVRGQVLVAHGGEHIA